VGHVASMRRTECRVLVVNLRQHLEAPGMAYIGRYSSDVYGSGWG